MIRSVTELVEFLREHDHMVMTKAQLSSWRMSCWRERVSLEAKQLKKVLDYKGNPPPLLHELYQVRLLERKRT